MKLTLASIAFLAGMAAAVPLTVDLTITGPHDGDDYGGDAWTAIAKVAGIDTSGCVTIPIPPFICVQGKVIDYLAKHHGGGGAAATANRVRSMVADECRVFPLPAGPICVFQQQLEAAEKTAIAAGSSSTGIPRCVWDGTCNTDGNDPWAGIAKFAGIDTSDCERLPFPPFPCIQGKIMGYLAKHHGGRGTAAAAAALSMADRVQNMVANECRVIPLPVGPICVFQQQLEAAAKGAATGTAGSRSTIPSCVWEGTCWIDASKSRDSFARQIPFPPPCFFRGDC